MNIVEVLNSWGVAWSGFMIRAFIDTAALLALIVVVWLPVRRRLSAQLAHGVFCLVLLKLVVPVPVGWSWWQPWASAQQAVERVGAWAIARPPTSPDVVTAAPAPLRLPLTGDLGASPADSMAPQPVVLAAPAAPQLVAQAGKPVGGPSGAAKAPSASLSWPAWIMIGWACCATILLARFFRRSARRGE